MCSHVRLILPLALSSVVGCCAPLSLPTSAVRRLRNKEHAIVRRRAAAFDSQNGSGAANILGDISVHAGRRVER